MPRKSKADKLIEIHQKALEDFDAIQSAVRDEREQCLEDRRFYSISGAQWEGTLEEQFSNKPKFELNKIHLSVIRIINEYRNNRITVDFVPIDGDDDDLADTCDGRYRADEDKSEAQEAYDNAFEEAVGGGMGSWRLTTCYEDEDDDENEYQRISFEPIYDADSTVFFDLSAKKQDKSDAKYAYVITALPLKTYEEMFDDSPSSWPKEIDQSEFDWSTPDVVYVAEYYLKEEIPETVEIWADLNGEETRYRPEDFENDPSLFEMLTATGSRKVREKPIKCTRIHKYLLSGNDILEDCGYIVGKNIPIVPVYGKRWIVDSIERCMGHVRLSKDAQRLINMQFSQLAEIAALSPREKPIFLGQQVAGFETMWSEDNIKDWPYLLTNPIEDMNGNIQAAGPVAYTKPPQVPPAMAALLQLSEQGLTDLLGNQQAGEQVQPNISGKAIELIQNKLDMQSFIYMDNMAKAVKRSGEIWLSMAKEIYAEQGRKLKIMSPQKDIDSIEINQPVINPDTGEMEYKNDFSKAKFDLSVQVGPSTASKRAATVRALTGMLQMTQDPESQAVIGAMAMMNMEGEGIDEIRQYYRKKLIRMGAIQPNEKEQQELAAEQQAMANQPASPEQQYLQALSMEAQAKAQKAQADTMGTQADAMLTVAQTEETKAKTAATIAEMDRKHQRETVETIKDLTTLQQAPAQPQNA